jgi:hypothetical protein
LGRYYLWFVIVTAALAALPRLLLATRLAELQQGKLMKKVSFIRSKMMSLVLLAGTVIVAVGYFVVWRGHELWLQVAIIFSILSTAELFLQAQFPSREALVFQNRILGILYLGLSIGSFVLLTRT